MRLFAGAELPGVPWKVSGHRDYPQRITNDRAVLIAECYDEPTKQRTTAEFIAHAPTDIEDLLAEVERLQQGAEQTEAAAQEAANILGNALIHPAPSNCWGQIASADSECGVCRARAILLAALDQPAKEEP